MSNAQNNVDFQGNNYCGDFGEHKIPQRFIKDLKGKQYVTYEGLLDMSHQKGIQALETDLVAMPCEANGFTAIAKAVLIGKDGTKFVEFGDANSKSVNSMIAPHIIRMALTRAKARVMRDFTNIGICSVDEINFDDMSVEEELASDKQKSILINYSEELGLSDEEIENITKSQASYLIDRLFNKSNKNGQNVNQKDSKSKRTNVQEFNNQQKPQQQKNQQQFAGKNTDYQAPEYCSSSQVSFMKKLIIDIASDTGRAYADIQNEILRSNKVEALDKLSPFQARKVINVLQQKSA